MLDVWLSATRVTDEAGRPTGVATTERNITERKRRQADLERLSQELEQRVAERTRDLQARERELTALADNVPALFSYVDANERYRYVNRRYEELFKVPVSQLIGKPIKELLGRGPYKATMPYLRRVLAGEAVRFERDLELPDGARTFNVKYVPDFAKPGEVRGFFALASDVTEQRQREIALRASEDRLRAVVETAAEAIITISGDGTIRSFNPAAEQMFGFAATETIGQKVEMLMPSPYREEHDRYLRRYRRTRVPRIIGTRRELTGRRKDGSTFPLELSVSNVDHLDLFTGLIRDISERKRGEEREREHQAELAHVLRVATAGELASGLAHELHQPLTAISNNIQACVTRIQTGEDAESELLRVLQQTADEALRAGAIVHSIRDIVKKRPVHYQRIDLRLPIRRASTLLSGEMERHNIHMQLTGIQKPVAVKADALQIEQVLINLMQNAIDAIGEAGGKRRQLVITLSRTGRGMAEVAVRDTGPGVAKAVAGRLFDPFFSTKAHGLGVGLALSRTIIEAHGGRLWLEPRRGRGATFRFTVPVYSGKRSHHAGATSAPPDREVVDG